MFLVGLTGGIASGKSLVSSIFEEFGIPVIDADLIARQIVEPGKPAYHKIQQKFGLHVFKDNGELDREKLGAEIFSNIEKKKILNSITHPYIYGEMRKKVLSNFFKGEQFVVLDLPLLYETRSVLPYLFKTIVVTCDSDVQLDRLMKRNCLSKSDAMKRIEAQLSLDHKVSLANFVIENSGSKINTRNQVENIVTYLKASKQHWKNRALIVFIVLIFFGISSFLLKLLLNR